MTAALSDDSLADLFAPAARQSRIALAVSGGSDSMALLHMAQLWARRSGVSLHALTLESETWFPETLYFSVSRSQYKLPGSTNNST